MAAVSLRNVRKVYGRGPAAYVAVHDLDLDVADGEFVVLVGPSGCGKSTVLRMIAGLEDITDGAMHIGERRVNDVAPGARDIAMVFQTYALYPHMTVYDNLAFALRLARRDREAVDRRVRAAASAMHIVPLLPRFPRQLSGGERQRVALGRALVREPQVFLFDEPLSNLDARLRVEMRREIARLHRDLGTTMLYVTHDQVEAMTLGDRIVVLRAGRVQQVDTPSALYAAPASVFVARFIGSPGMNIVQGTVQGVGPTRHIANDHSLRVPLPTAWSATLAARGDASVLIGIRPEHILWREAGDDAPTTEPPHLIVRVEHVEHLGNEFVVHGHADVTELAVRASADRRAPVVGALLALWFDLDQVHCFDPVTEMRLPQ